MAKTSRAVLSEVISIFESELILSEVNFSGSERELASEDSHRGQDAVLERRQASRPVEGGRQQGGARLDKRWETRPAPREREGAHNFQQVLDEGKSGDDHPLVHKEASPVRPDALPPHPFGHVSAPHVR